MLGTVPLCFYLGSASVLAIQWICWGWSHGWPSVTLRLLLGDPGRLNSGAFDLFLNQLFDFPLAVLLLLTGLALTGIRAFVRSH